MILTPLFYRMPSLVQYELKAKGAYLLHLSVKIYLFSVFFLFAALEGASSQALGSPALTKFSRLRLKHHMKAYEHDGIQVTSMDYLRFIGSLPIQDEDRLSGFYNEEASLKSKICAEASYDLLKHYVTKGWFEMLRLIEMGAPSEIYIVVSDYTNATPGRKLRKNTLWLWDPSDYRSGIWVWETVLNQRGHCMLPFKEDIRRELLLVYSEMTQFKN